MGQSPWSWSRHRQLHRCVRAYAFDYHVARRGARADAPADLRQVWTLKRLVGFGQAVGIAVHRVAEEGLRRARAGRDPDLPALSAAACAAAAEDVARWRAGRFFEDPASTVGFEDAFYGVEGAEAGLDGLVGDLASQLAGLQAHPVWARLVAAASRVVEVEEFARWTWRGVPIVVALDVLVRDGQGGLVVVDWKTGHHADADAYRDQVALYASYAADRYGVAPERVRGLLVSTRTGGHTIVPWDAARRDALAEVVRASAARMAEVDARRGEGLGAAPLPPGDPTCASCRYRRACDREG
jgi:CRISPR/Cas system-associated exonuclease Cas4 (RecB family)